MNKPEGDPELPDDGLPEDLEEDAAPPVPVCVPVIDDVLRGTNDGLPGD